ncbi:transposase [Mesorhizobium sp. M8A.F.Ca.ET.165.01.1.1]|uniref:terminase small subunit-like protein n=1 Tax=Mesorhizobium sp. M8A.F.Ca.ET.165.01.1.1 TaxID=2563960 RepID=UPI001093ED84|nr:transposase [Mesorhizobium sp. M8A.F.Ca.ET.165.01.1.1]TGT42772.1 hypothetical protein EN808_12890 [Mesorhizobium sp. M8A.F.Ca.ET.165.01.1.1]
MAAPITTSYTSEEKTEIIKRICGLIIQSSVDKACQEVGIDDSTFYAWLAADDELADEYARARKAISYKGEQELERINKQVENAQLEPAAANVISQNTRWLMGRRNPKVYGDKLTTENENKNTNLSANVADLSDVPDEKVKAAREVLFGK